MSELLRSLACALALAVPSVAAAEVVTLTGAGLVTYGLDQTGVYGDPGELAGRTALLTLRYDTNLAPAGVGGVFSSEAPGWLRLELAVDGVPFAFADGGREYYASIELTEGGAQDIFSLVYLAVGPIGPPPVWTDVAQVLTVTFTGNLFDTTDSLPLLAGPLSASGTGDVFLDDLTCTTSICNPLNRADVGLELSQLAAVTSGTAVPEPGAWLVMILGFSAAGAMLRMARASRAPSASAALPPRGLPVRTA